MTYEAKQIVWEYRDKSNQDRFNISETVLTSSDSSAMVQSSLQTPRTPPLPRRNSVVEKRSSRTLPIAFSILVALAASRYRWVIRWLISGAPVLSFVVLLGASKGSRILPAIPLWTILVILNLVYAVSATSWLFYIMFALGAYPAIFITSLFQFDYAARLFRRNMRKLLKQLQFVNDTIAFFDIPALEIDVDVDGLMVIRGLEFSWSTLTVVAHGIEVGIKLSDDMELSISTERVRIPLFRRIEISDCYANVKGGEHEMTFGNLEANTKDEDGDALMVEATPLLKAATAGADTSRPKMIKMTSYMTGGDELRNSSAQEGFRSMTKLSPDDSSASKQFKQIKDWIYETNSIQQARRAVIEEIHRKNEEGETSSMLSTKSSKSLFSRNKEPKPTKEDEMDVDLTKTQDLRAAICSQMHNIPSVPHPPARSVKVTTLQNLSSPRTRGFLHRMPLLLRLLLNPLAYFHPVSISSITVAGSGKWMSQMLQTMVFKDYSDDSRELRKLEKRILDWLSDAHFVFQLADITGIASVPIMPSNNIATLIKIADVMAYRSLAEGQGVEQVLRLGGADAAFEIPSFLLPHHEHLLPDVPNMKDKEALEEQVETADGKPKEIQAEKELDQAEKDEANVQISVHVKLPACFSQDLLDFIAALVKATKVVELEKAPGALEEKMSGIKDFTQALSKGMKDSMKRTVVDGMVNDKWIAKMVGKITKKLEEAMGEVGYTGDIPVKLEKYRLPEGHPEMAKLLP